MLIRLDSKLSYILTKAAPTLNDLSSSGFAITIPGAAALFTCKRFFHIRENFKTNPIIYHIKFSTKLQSTEIKSYQNVKLSQNWFGQTLQLLKYLLHLIYLVDEKPHQKDQKV